MTSAHTDGRTIGARCWRGVLLAGLMSLLVLIPGGWTVARSADGDQACLSCHGSAGLEKKLENADTLSLHIEARAFAKSVHDAVGCAACHSDISLDAHPPTKKVIKSARDYSVTSAEVCRGCHSDKIDQWQTSIHASLVRDGNAAAPVCTDCHGPHAIIKGASATMAGVPCKNCHVSVYEAYAGSMHGKARSKSDQGLSPLCADCHRAHDVSAASAGDGLKNACLGCHAGALDVHKTWLPNAALHFEVVSCPACHAPTAQRRVDLRLYDEASQSRLSEQHGVPQFQSRALSADADGKGLDAMALWTLLKAFNGEEMKGKTTLLARLEVRNGADAHKLTEKGKAISDCKICHQKGSEAFNSVTVSIAGPDGRPIRYGASKDVLSSVISLDSISGFYAIGATRITLLDILLVLSLLAGAGIVGVHASARVIARRYMRNNHAAQK